MSGGAFAAIFYNQLHYCLLVVTSSVHSTVFGNVKIMLVVIVSIIYFKTVETPINLVGIGIGFVGMFIYTYVYYSAKRALIRKSIPAKDIEMQKHLIDKDVMTRIFGDSDDEI